MTETLAVEGMVCEHCEQSVEEALESVDGVTEATADREEEIASISGTAEPEALTNAVADAGYEAST